MKAVYKKKTKIEIVLNDDTKITTNTDFLCGRYVYNYGNVPEDENISYIVYGKFNEEMQELCCQYCSLLEYCITGRLNKKHLIRIRTSYSNWRKVQIKDVKFVNVLKKYEIVDNPKIKWLEEDLGFKGYSELVFDREQELKSLLLKG